MLTQVCAPPPRASFPRSQVWLVFSMGQVVVRTQSLPQGLQHCRHLPKFSFFFGTDTEMNLILWRETGPAGRDLMGKSFFRGGKDSRHCGSSPEAPRSWECSPAHLSSSTEGPVNGSWAQPALYGAQVALPEEGLAEGGA